MAKYIENSDIRNVFRYGLDQKLSGIATESKEIEVECGHIVIADFNGVQYRLFSAGEVVSLA